ncbi:hypothetical protein COU76_02400 [Candidatus Peregrinibacteria bacterium CG10_big_fil_rev_8_21_14_0_10_49_10]|nr:MAG: hypothetical protein COU76_02400 [Candidatus Peregrinibacteria bacterium CG10_big_fil_rev_8_21_14_0_10_49_10]
MQLQRSPLLCTVLSGSLLLHTLPAVAATFPDMENAWFRHREAVEFLVKRGVLQGYPDGTFKPDQVINRAEFLKIVFQGRSGVEPVGRRCFSDVNPDAWFAPYVCAAKRRGIVDGYPDGTFRPGQTVNTAEALKMALNAYQWSVTEGKGEKWHQPYVEYLDTNDILGEHAYTPWADLTRVHAADLIWRLLRFEEEWVIPRYSPGCEKAQPFKPSAVVVNGEQRSFLLTIPASYSIETPAPLLIAFHGRTNSNQDVRQYYGFDKEAKEAIVVYPAARKTGSSFTYGAQEVEMFDAMVELLASRYCIDMDRIFVAGHSLGGWFANTIACIRGDVVRGSASVGSSAYTGTCTGPTAAMLLHNPQDRLAPFAGSVSIRDQRLLLNACSNTSHSVSPRDLKCVEYEGCPANPIVFCPHETSEDYRGEFYPHNWPHQTGEAMWEFFETLK